MAIRGEWVRYGEGSGYLAVPERAAGPLPAVIVIQEVWGVDRHIEDVTRRIAAAGYAALAPDLYAVNGRRPEALAGERVEAAVGFARRFPSGTMSNPEARAAALATLPEGERGRVQETIGGIFSFTSPDRLGTLVPALSLAFRHLRGERPETRGRRVGCVGFCMGGGLSALLACEEPELSGAAVFYGRTPPAQKVPDIRCPVIGFYGGLDERVNSGLPAFREAMRAAGKSFEEHVYPGANHAFFNDDGPAYDPGAVRDSYARLLRFFADSLGG